MIQFKLTVSSVFNPMVNLCIVDKLCTNAVLTKLVLKTGIIVSHKLICKCTYNNSKIFFSKLKNIVVTLTQIINNNLPESL